MTPLARSGANRHRRYGGGDRLPRGASGRNSFRPIRAGTVQAVSLLVIDALHFKAAMQIIP